jgi:ribonuclease D
VLPDDCLIALARKPADTSDQLAAMKGFPKKIAMKFGKKILSSILDAQELTPIRLRKPQSIEKEANTRQELDGLWSLFCAWCVGNELSPSLVASRATFTDWYLAIRTGNEPPTSTLTSGWRSVILTPFIQFMQGKEQIEFSLCDSLLARVKE